MLDSIECVVVVGLSVVSGWMKRRNMINLLADEAVTNARVKTAHHSRARKLSHALPHAVRLQLEEVLVHVAWSGLGSTLGGPLL